MLYTHYESLGKEDQDVFFCVSESVWCLWSVCVCGLHPPRSSDSFRVKACRNHPCFHLVKDECIDNTMIICIVYNIYMYIYIHIYTGTVSACNICGCRWSLQESYPNCDMNPNNMLGRAEVPFIFGLDSWIIYKIESYHSHDLTGWCPCIWAYPLYNATSPDDKTWS